MVKPWIIDVICAAILVIAFLIGRKRGIIRMLWSLVAWAATIALALTLAAPAGEFIDRSPMAETARTTFEKTISDRIRVSGADQLTTQNIAALTSLPLSFVNGITNDGDLARVSEGLINGSEQAINTASRAVSEGVVKLLAKAAGFLALIIVIRIALALLFRILNIASKLPVINGTNRLLGGLLGVAVAIIFIYIILAYIAVFVAGDTGLAIGQTYLVKYFYNNNILLLLSGR